MKLSPIIAAVLLTALAGAAYASDAAEESLYTRIGGETRLARISDRLIDASAKDPQTSRTFEQKVNIPRLKQLITEQLVALSGGPKKYTGDDMKVSHAGLGISEAEFYGMVEHLREILDSEGVGAREKNELLRLLAPMKRDIVEVRKPAVAANVQ
jgi:hemoglobin